MPFASDEEIAAIGRGVLDLSLPKPKWTHEAHFAAALWLMSCRKDLDARRDMPRNHHPGVVARSLEFLDAGPATQPVRHVQCLDGIVLRQIGMAASVLDP